MREGAEQASRTAVQIIKEVNNGTQCGGVNEHTVCHWFASPLFSSLLLHLVVVVCVRERTERNTQQIGEGEG